MTIASAFNDIAVAQGGTASKSGAITAAIDALNDALAGSDQPQAKTIEQAVRLLGEHIGGGGGIELGVLSLVNITYAGDPAEGLSFEVSYAEQNVATVLFPMESPSFAGGLHVAATFACGSAPNISATFGPDGSASAFTDYSASYDEGMEMETITFDMPNGTEDNGATLTFACTAGE